MDLPRVFHGGTDRTELKSYFCIFQRGLEPRARLDVIVALRQGVKEVAVDKTGTMDRTVRYGSSLARRSRAADCPCM